MLDFTKDTDWFISSHFYARKFTGEDSELIKYFVQQYHFKNPSCDSSIENVMNLCLSSLAEYTTGKMFAVGVIDRRSSQLAAMIWIEVAQDSTLANLKIILLEDFFRAAEIADSLVWAIDYTFYQLYCQEILVFIDKKSVKTLNAGIKLGLNVYNYVQDTTSSLTGCSYDCQIFHLLEQNWLVQGNLEYLPMDVKKSDQYIQEVIKPFFQPSIDASLYSTIVDFRYEVIMSTTLSARSIGLSHAVDLLGSSYKYYSRIDTAIWYFGKWYTEINMTAIHHYARKIFRIQQYVFKNAHSVSYIDSLPYDRGIQSYLVIFVPIFDLAKKVVAIQTLAFNYRLAGYHEYMQNLLNNKKVSENTISNIKLSRREEEVLFLLISGITQGQIAEILEIKRETVAAIIRNQLRVKFLLPLVNTKLLIETAIARGFPDSIPESLWRPSVIVLEDKLAAWLKQYDSVG